jgi:tryptophan-rich sensory protein
VSAPARRLVAAATAFTAAVAAMVAVIAAGDRFIDQRNRFCNLPRPPAAPRLPWYELPLGIAATVLMGLSATAAVLAYRRAGATSWSRPAAVLLAVAALAGALFAAWFGIGAVLAEPSGPPTCGG